MTEEQKSTSTTWIIAGLIGALLAYIYLKNKNPTITLQQPNQNISFNWKPLSNNPNQTTIQPQNINSETIPNETSYKNSEKWKITRTVDGDIDEIEVIRDAKITK